MMRCRTFNEKQEVMIDFSSRTRLLVGDECAARLAETRVIVFGVGGVGSWCVEGLVRSGVSHITIVDQDRVCPSNINRQLMATAVTVGQVKVDALKEHLLEINPDADIDARHEAFNASTADSFGIGGYDYVIDAIDSLPDKMLLIRTACDAGVKLFSSMGAARKLDPTCVKVAEFWRVHGCPLARSLRQGFRRSGQMPSGKFMCVFSDELLDNAAKPDEPHANGSMVHVTAVFGFTLAGLVIGDIAKNGNTGL